MDSTCFPMIVQCNNSKVELKVGVVVMPDKSKAYNPAPMFESAESNVTSMEAWAEAAATKPAAAIRVNFACLLLSAESSLLPANFRIGDLYRNASMTEAHS